MRDPWMKWYPSDWRSDPGLRCCSLAARGLWVEMLCVMHEAPRRGYLLVGNSAPTPQQLAVISGSSIKETNRLLAQLMEAGVFSVEDGIIYSRRMVRDEKQRVIDRENGRKGGNPKLKGWVNPPDKGGDKAKKLEARGKKERLRTAKAVRSYDEQFEAAWQAYPKRSGDNPKAPAAKLFLAAVKAGENPQTIIDGAKGFAIAEARNVGTQYIQQMVKWLRNKRWLDFGPGQPATVFDIKRHLA